MNSINYIVSAAGLGLIAWIIWYFWLWRGSAVETTSGQTGIQEIDITVKGGYQPALILARSGRPVRLNFTRREASLCGEEVVIPDFGKRAHLPEGQSVRIEFTPAKPGEYEFTCGMNMYRGKLIVK